MTQGVVLDDASPADAAAVARVHKLCFVDPWDEDFFAYLLALPSSLAVVERHDQAIAGFVLCRLVVDEGEVLTCAVAPARRGRGVGYRLITAALTTLRHEGAKRVLLEVAEDASAARQLYGRCGFRPVGRRARYYARPSGHSIDAIIMQCDL